MTRRLAIAGLVVLALLLAHEIALRLLAPRDLLQATLVRFDAGTVTLALAAGALRVAVLLIAPPWLAYRGVLWALDARKSGTNWPRRGRGSGRQTASRRFSE